jgi:hypothetical protein
MWKGGKWEWGKGDMRREQILSVNNRSSGLIYLFYPIDGQDDLFSVSRESHGSCQVPELCRTLAFTRKVLPVSTYVLSEIGASS